MKRSVSVFCLQLMSVLFPLLCFPNALSCFSSVPLLTQNALNPLCLILIAVNLFNQRSSSPSDTMLRHGLNVGLSTLLMSGFLLWIGFNPPPKTFGLGATSQDWCDERFGKFVAVGMGTFTLASAGISLFTSKISSTRTPQNQAQQQAINQPLPPVAAIDVGDAPVEAQPQPHHDNPNAGLLNAAAPAPVYGT